MEVWKKCMAHEGEVWEFKDGGVKLKFGSGKDVYCPGNSPSANTLQPLLFRAGEAGRAWFCRAVGLTSLGGPNQDKVTGRRMRPLMAPTTINADMITKKYLNTNLQTHFVKIIHPFFQNKKKISLKVREPEHENAEQGGERAVDDGHKDTVHRERAALIAGSNCKQIQSLANS
ncbi:hypothetical protein WR25_02854 [Diploscapter pachys]|uniref:Uncharacterized protein n=1 Tax=Diploscapter pachys TaxID=2018661 RepID=A0A2A2KQ29_9BILA|nr:hypothetical protein WR25_02854 [Diploscapter pachys]